MSVVSVSLVQRGFVGWLTTLVCAWLACTTALATGTHERGLPPFRHHPPTEYGGHNQTFQTAQDARGIIYLTTYGAVQAFDGERWERIPVPGAGFLYGIAALPDGSLAVCGVGVIGLLQTDAGGTWRYRSLIEELPAADREGVGEVWDMFATPGGLFFFTRRMMLRWHGGGMSVWHFETDRMIYGFWSGSAVYVQNLGHGLFRLEGEEVRVVSDAPLFREPGPRMILDDADNGLLVVTMKDGLWHLRGDEPAQVQTEADPYLRERFINRGIRLKDGRLALGTYHGGVVVLTKDGRFDFLFDEDSGLPMSGINNLAEDREGGLWCSLNSGVVRVDTSGILTHHDIRTNLPGVTVTTIRRHRDSVYLASTSGLFRLQSVPAPAIPRWERIPEASGEMYKLVEHDDELFAAVEGRVVHFDGQSWTTVWDDFGLIRAVVPSRRDPDRVFIGGRIGLGSLFREDGIWKATLTVAALDEDYVESMIETPDGALWLGTAFSGLARVTSDGHGAAWPTEARVERVGADQGLPAQRHLSLRLRGDALIVTSPDGVFVRDAATDTFAPLSADAPTAPLPGWAWDASVRNDEGVLRGTVYPTAGGSDDFNTYFGRQLPGDTDVGRDPKWQWIPPALFDPIGGVRYLYSDQDESGAEILWVGGWTGLLRWEVDRAPLGVAPRVPEVSIRRVTHATHGTLFAGAGTPKHWEHAHSRQALRFDFAAPIHTPGVTVAYRSRLDGYESEWTDWSSAAAREFTNLPAGRYRFLVEARTDLATSVAPAVAAFSIAPPWYFTAPAYAGYLAAFGLLLWGGVRWRLGAARRENRRLESIVATRTAELRENEVHLREARDAADRANRAKSRFLANMSHELRTPLNAIMGYAQILGRDSTIGEENLRRIDVLRSSGGLLLHLINEVLDLSKVEAGKIEVRPVPTDPRRMVGDLVESFRPKAKSMGLALTLATAPAFPERVVLDSRRVEQILFNLIGNALKFTARGEVRIEIGESGNGFFRIDVKDTGEGIPPSQLASIFEPFQQGEAEAPSEPGTGLGLAISRALAMALGGTLTCESAHGRGSCFRLELPLLPVAAPAARTTVEQTIIGYAGRPRRVLVVDDLEVNRDIVGEMLEPLGFHVKGADGGASALAQVDTHPPDLILMDMRMQPMDGAETLRRLRASENGRALPVISYSASLIDFSREDAISLGCNDSIGKPFLLEELLSKIGALLGIEWIWSAEAPEPAAPPAYAFAATDLERLRALAHRREPAGLKRELERIRAADPTARATVDPLLTLVRAFRLAEVSHALDHAQSRSENPT